MKRQCVDKPVGSGNVKKDSIFVDLIEGVEMKLTSTKPYLIRAIYEWCTDNGYTPYLVVAVRDEYTQVPLEYVKNQEIVLDIGFDATKNLIMQNDSISFSARFNGIARPIFIPIGAVLAIFAKETGNGMSFEYEEMPEGETHASTCFEKGLSVVSDEEEVRVDHDDTELPHPPVGKPKLTIVE